MNRERPELSASDRATAPALVFASDCRVSDSAGFVELSRMIDGRPRSCLLSRTEALLVSLLERGLAPSSVLRGTAAQNQSVDEVAARLRAGLRGFLDPAMEASQVFAPPATYSDSGTVPGHGSAIRRDFLPRDLVWYVTHRCPRTCTYCHWVDKGRSDLEHGALPNEQVPELIEEAWVSGVERLVLTGGEPMLRRDLPEIIACATTRGLRVELFTRFAMTESRARRLVEAGTHAVYYSLDDVDRDVNALMVERASIADEALQSLRTLCAAGLSVTVVPVITRLNAGHLGRLAEIVARCGVMQMRPIAYKGRAGNSNNDLFTLTGSDKDAVLDGLRFAETLLQVDRSTLDLDRKHGICESGLSTVYMQPDGSVAYCPLAGNGGGTSFGRLPTDALSDLWRGPRLAALLAANGLLRLDARTVDLTRGRSVCTLQHERLDII